MRDKWNKNYMDYQYKDVFSILDSPCIIDKFRNSISIFKEKKKIIRILIPGCGSNTKIQQLCYSIYKENIDIYAVDWSEEAIAIAKKETNLLNIPVEYINCNFNCLPFDDDFFDIVIISNSIVSDSHENNINALNEFARLLNPDGLITGNFPCAFGMFDYALTSGLADHWLTTGIVDIISRTVYEESQDMHQRFFTPLELFSVCKEMQLKIESMNILFYDGADFAQQMSTLYQLPYNENFSLWGLYVNIKKYTL
ncbi:class I SAM-dependent methyltransferase [Parabacteroides sp. PF5-9]|uniref:class I SAM-dependent methyltransferase n=1 Tax=Parabacteroides sp. PF5-9 TaxID=1742404 RepID=UPI002473DC11|nr:class I SAM-dependent methyltransferase [Parabacteroides sp. PF5-9]MDH6356353.1 ubiquinone/menaquinone biosynthesis C-methylase UbiE [Parabacteroides sp. PF5-9]